MSKNRIKKISFISIFIIVMMYIFVFHNNIFENFQNIRESDEGQSTLTNENQVMYVVTLKYMYKNGTLADSKDVYCYADGESINLTIPQLDGYTSNINNINEVVDENFLDRIGALDYVEIAKEENYNIYRIYYTVTYIPAPSKYKVCHYLQETDGSYTKKYEETVSDNVFIGDTVTTDIVDYDGYYFNREASTYLTTVNRDGTSKLSLYYDRNTNHIYLDSNGGTYYEPISVMYGARINLSGYVPTREGYLFRSWSCINKETGEEITAPTTMPNNDIYYKANWNKTNTEFSIIYLVENENDSNYSNIGTKLVSGIETGTNVASISNLQTLIRDGFNTLKSGETGYFHLNEEKSSPGYNVEIKGDGSTNVYVYYDRNVYTLTFDLGSKSGSNYQIYTGVSSSWSGSSLDRTNVSNNNVTLNMGGSSYNIDSGKYTITAKYGENIAEKYPVATIDVAPKSITVSSGGWWSRDTTYYPYSWNYITTSGGYQQQVSGIYTLNKDLLRPSTSGGVTTYTGTTFYLTWNTSSSDYTVHYMFEKIDGSGFEENTAYQIKSANTNFGYKTIDNFYYTGSSAEQKGNDLYLYYYRNTYELRFFNVNERNVLPNTSGITLGEGITLVNNGDNKGFDIKYGASLASLKDVKLDPEMYLGEKKGKNWVFDGWYLGPNVVTPVDWENMTMQDRLVVYAKWIPPEYTVNYDLSGGTWHDSADKYIDNGNGTYSEHVNEGETLSRPANPTREGYIFKGWYYKNPDGKEYEYLFSESQQIYNDLKLEARWEAQDGGTYTVKYVMAQYDSNGNLIRDLSRYTNPEYLLPDKVVDNIKFGTVVTDVAKHIERDGINLLIVDDYSKQLTISTNNDENVMCFFYSARNQMSYTVYYIEDTGVRYENGEIPPTSQMLATPKIEKIVTLGNLEVTEASIEIDGYEVDAYRKSTVLVADTSTVSASRNAIYFYYSPVERKGEYEINFFFMKEDGAYPDKPDYVSQGEDSVGKYIRANEYGKYLPLSNPLYEGHEYDEETSDILMIVISSSGKAVMNLYFKNAMYNIDYDTVGGDWTDTSDIYTQKTAEVYRTEVGYKAKAPIPSVPTKENNRFVGWYDKETDTLYDFNTPVTKDLKLYAKWISQKSITVKKVWEDKNNADGLRPDEVTIQLKKNNESIQTIKLNQDNKWQKIIENLDEYDENGNIVEYSIVEENVNDYTSSYTNEGDVYTVKNTHVPKTKEITIKKEWIDSNNQDGLRPKTITLELKQNDNLYSIVTLSEEDNWTKVEEVPVYQAGKVAQYSVEEIYVAGYTTEYNTSENEITVTNTHTPQTKSINVSKVWEDNDNQDGLRPANVTIKIKNQDKEVQSVVLNTSNAWQEEVPNLPVYENGVMINYTVEEVPVNYYTATYSQNNDDYIVTNTHTPEIKNMNIVKVWEDNNNQDGLRPESVVADLRANGSLIYSVTLNEANNWQESIGDLPVYRKGVKINYTLDEEEIGNYTSSVKENENGYEIVNTHEVEKTSLSAKKVWEDNNNQDGKRPESISVSLMANDKVVDTVELNESNSWKYFWDSIDKYSQGNEIEYTVEENYLEDYTFSSTYDSTSKTWTITNTHIPEKKNIDITKVWEDNNNQDGKRPNDISINLYADGNQINTITLNDTNNWYGEFNDLPLYKDGNVINYTISEVEVTDYTVNIVKNGDSYVITNTHIPERADRTVKKIWRDGSNKDNTRPDSMQFRLYKNGEEYSDIITLDASNSVGNTDEWEYTFNDLFVYENGEKISYTVKEIEVPTGYGVIYNQEKLYIFNAYPPEVELSVEKIWDDEDDADGIRPESVAVQLLADGKPYTIDDQNIGYVVLNEENNWNYVWGFAEKYNSEGERYEYSLQEVNLDGGNTYTSSISTKDDENPEFECTYVVTNTYKPQKTAKTVEVLWDDNNNQDGKRPESVTVHLFSNGKEISSVVLNNDNNWTYDFENINLNENGIIIEYTVAEDNVPFYDNDITYDDSTNKFTIVNKHIPETKGITINKIWNDNNNQDGKRPETIDIVLKANNVEIRNFVLVSNQNWNTIIESLPVYEAGVEINYTIEEKEVTDYDTTYAKNGDVYTVTNTHIPEKRIIKISKVWNDDDNRDGIRPTNIKVSLKANDVVIKDNIVLNSSNNWLTQVEVDKYSNGSIIDYTLEEETINKYYADYSYDMDNNSIVINNTHVPEKINLLLNKTWQDEENIYGVRPENILVDILANGNVVATVTLEEASGWSTSVNGLNLNEHGTEITYSVREHQNDYYTVSIGKEDNTFNITNTIKTYKIKTEVIGIGGNISGNKLDYYEKVIHDSTNTKPVTITPNEGYKINKIEINGVEQELPEDRTKSYTLPSISNITEDKNITVEFSKIEYSITTEVINGNGIISGENEDPYEVVLHGENSIKDIVITPNEGYEIDRLIINGVEQELPEDISYPYTLGKFINVKENVHISVGYKRIESKVIVSYVTKNNKKLTDDVIIDGYIGENYSTEEKTFENYVLISKTDNFEGIMDDRTIKVIYTYEYRPNMYISKIVKGSYADINKKFEFSIKLLDESANVFTGSIKYQVMNEAQNVLSQGELLNGIGTIYIGHNERATLFGIPEGTKYSIEEVNCNDYRTDINGIYAEDKKIEGIINDEELIEYVNEKEYISPTGIVLTALPFAIGIVIVAVIFIAITKFKKNRR